MQNFSGKQTLGFRLLMKTCTVLYIFTVLLYGIILSNYD